MPAQIKDWSNSVYGDSVSLFTTVKFWAAEFKRGRKSLEGDERSEHPNTATTDENITKSSPNERVGNCALWVLPISFYNWNSYRLSFAS
ncbi:hypothetical protein TNCV_4871481 [Trichonephila clavipes]|nr:hypothetical protein TNCV_4871481 [Trichonephila clavipes]